uniref:CCHC-type domain-containing protein n=1 Tax=Oryzias latipes TaxID=8090 RepID=A0A3B3IIS5_ORYLA
KSRRQFFDGFGGCNRGFPFSRQRGNFHGAAARSASVATGGVERSQRVDGGETSSIRYERDLTIHVELVGEDPVSVSELLRYSRLLCGGVVACRSVGQKRYELTMSNAVGRDKLLDGFKIGNTTVQGRSISNDELVVSFLGLPAYVTDEEILEKLEGWRVSAVSPIKRRMWPGTSVADGTRFVKVKFNESVQSLPYSAKFNTATGPEFFRVIHDKQVKVCRICIKPGHIVRDCPDFLCNKCGVQGHYARECVSSIQKCAVCLNMKENCVCLGAAEETVASDVSDSARDSASEEDLSDSVSDGRVKSNTQLWVSCFFMSFCVFSFLFFSFLFFSFSFFFFFFFFSDMTVRASSKLFSELQGSQRRGANARACTL